MKHICGYCGKECEKEQSQINRANRKGLKLYCNLQCAGAGKRKGYTDEDKKRIKREYDEQYRSKNKDLLKAKKHEYFKRTYDPVQAAIDRRKRYHRHLEYLQTPQYRAWKQEYDQKYRAKKLYGEFWESALLIMKIEGLYDAREIREINNLHNKTQKRRRQWRQLKRLNYLRAR
jgi:hypothetical protein